VEVGSEGQVGRMSKWDGSTRGLLARLWGGVGWRDVRGGAVFTATLFAALAAVQIGLALLKSRVPQASVDIYFHATYLVIRKNHLQILLAIANVSFAVIYFAGSRSVTHPLSKALGLAHFVLSMVGFVFLTVTLSWLTRELPSVEAQVRYAFLLVTGVLCLLLGCAILAVNCALTGIAALRSH